MPKPSDSVALERAFSLANEAMFTVALQRRRLRSTEPEDEVFLFRWWADLQFLIVALRRLRRAAEVVSRIPSTVRVSDALKAFDNSLPGLATMRNVGEHIDEYVLGSGYNRQIDRKAVQVGTWDGTTYEWLGEKLDVDVAHSAAAMLHSVLRDARRSEGGLF